MLLLSRFENFLKMCGLEMGCDTKWSKSQIEDYQNMTCAKYVPFIFGQSDLRSVELRKSEVSKCEPSIFMLLFYMTF